MSWIECLLIIAGVTLDLCAAMECEGSLVLKVNKKQLLGVCVLAVISQIAALFIGYFASNLYCRYYSVSNEIFLGEIIAVIIFFGLGFRLLVKGVKNERMEEHLLTSQDVARFVRIARRCCIYTLLAGIAFGFLQTDFVCLLIMIAVLAVVFVIGGMYAGYYLGFAQKGKVYLIGTVLLWSAGIDILVRSVN